tara:strand:+ start:334 stop:456 length:123 start_codon:yes stop_codon:yes gene_type:complete
MTEAKVRILTNALNPLSEEKWHKKRTQARSSKKTIKKTLK